ISIVIGIILLVVSLYLSLRRIRARPDAPVGRAALITIIYGLLFIVVGAMIERTSPVAPYAEPGKLPKSEILQKPPETLHPRVEESVVDTGRARELVQKTDRQKLSRRMEKRKPVPVGRKEEGGPPTPSRWTPEDRMVAAVDAVLRRIEVFFERYGTPVEMESPEPVALSLRPIFFGDTTADIPPKYFPLLDQTARILRQHPETGIIEVQAHTNGEGPEVYNFLITQSRANAARDYLVARGVEPDRLVAKGYGTTVPCVVISDSSKQPPNRRIEFVPISKPRTNRN
ncbi:MAG: OmpA family protein, partial [bacterium]